MTDNRQVIVRKLKTVYRVLIKGAKDAGYKIGAQAEDLGIKPVTISNASNPDNLQHLPPIDMIISHALNIKAYYDGHPNCVPPCSHFAVLDEMEFIAGRVAFTLPEIAGDPNGISTILAENVQEFGDVLQKVGEVLEDNKIYQHEYDSLETEVMQQVRKTMAMLHAARDLIVKDRRGGHAC